MANKNRPTLKQQFADFINRVAPFDAAPLIQKTEHLTVEDDLFDSTLLKTDSGQLINSPAAAFNVDFATFDLYDVNTSGSVDVSFTITVNNLSTGQVGRISVTKKSNDTISFANATTGQISNVNQFGTSIVFYIHNISGTLIAINGNTIPKNDSTNLNSTDSLATSKAVHDLNSALSILITALQNDKVNISDIINNLTSTSTTKPLAANQGRVLNINKANLTTTKLLFDVSGAPHNLSQISRLQNVVTVLQTATVTNTSSVSRKIRVYGVVGVMKQDATTIHARVGLHTNATPSTGNYLASTGVAPFFPVDGSNNTDDRTVEYFMTLSPSQVVTFRLTIRPTADNALTNVGYLVIHSVGANL